LTELGILAGQARQLMEEFLARAPLREDQILVLGCSSSEIAGQTIGKGSSPEIASVIFREIHPVLEQRGVFLAVQCCEHLNRALVVEEVCARLYCLKEVLVLPHLKAGGAMATEAMSRFDRPVVVESIQADAGIDIGDTFIGMHIRPVGIPVRTGIRSLGEAHVTCIRRRPPLIGGERARYPRLTGGEKWEDLKTK